VKVLLLDPKLLDWRGHYFHADLAIYEECTARGIAIEVLANHAVSGAVLARLPARPFFSLTALPSHGVDGEPGGDLEADNRAVERDLRERYHKPLGGDDALLVPSARDNHLGGIFRWYASLPRPRPRVCLRLLFEPGFGVRNGGRAVAEDLLREQLRAWVSVDDARLSLVVETRDLADYYASLSGLPVAVAPLPIRYPAPSEAEPVATRRSPHIVFVGEGRGEKGFRLLPSALQTTLAKHREIRLTLQSSRRFEIGEEDLRSLRQLAPDFSIVGGPLPTQDYERLLLSADIVLLPYDPEGYAGRASQIFLEAVGTGRIPLTTRGTWMQRELEKLGVTSVCIEQLTSEGIADAIERLLGEWPEAARRARQAAQEVRRHHNPARFVDELLRVLDGPRGNLDA
jgi:glycosyltransferase involved in cell wall biosynthesis